MFSRQSVELPRSGIQTGRTVQFTFCYCRFSRQSVELPRSGTQTGRTVQFTFRYCRFSHHSVSYPGRVGTLVERFTSLTVITYLPVALQSYPGWAGTPVERFNLPTVDKCRLVTL